MLKTPSSLNQIESLVEIVSQLRGPEGCPWDKEQTPESLTRFMIEEAHELVEAIEAPEGPRKDIQVKDELGDVLFQVLLHSQLAQERGAFNFQDVVQNLAEKIIRRHPHVFGEAEAKDTAAVMEHWHLIKKQEAEERQDSPYALNVPPLPALQRAFKIGQRTEKFHFDWEDTDGVLMKVEEEYAELREALEAGTDDEIAHEIGDILFSVAQLSRHLEMEPEQLLRKANLRFEKRFQRMIELCMEAGQDFQTLGLDEKEAFWQQAKKQLQAENASGKPG